MDTFTLEVIERRKYWLIGSESLPYDGSKYVLAGATSDSTKCYMRFEVADYDEGDYFYYDDEGKGVIVNHGELYPDSSDMAYAVCIHIDSTAAIGSITFNPILIKID